MTDGMKSGAGSDPFATETTDEEESTSNTEESVEDSDGETGGSESSEGTEFPSGQGSQSTPTEPSEEELPYIFSRSTVKDDRKMTQFFLREATQKTETDALREIEQEFGADVSLIDLREALVRVGADHLDEVADELREWGYRFREE